MLKKTSYLAVGAAVSLMSTTAMAGSITGKLAFTGTAPTPEEFAITKNPEVCGTGKRAVEWIRVRNGNLAQAVVFIDKIKGKKAWPKTAVAARSNQKGCAFLPFMDVIKNGTELEVMNSDPVLHNIHTYEIIGRAKRTMFNVSQPDKGFVFKEKVKARRGHWMKMECDAHNFMHGWRFLARNPYYAVTGDDGAFSITDVPAGEYKLTAWHPVLGKKTTTVTVTDGAATADFSFAE